MDLSHPHADEIDSRCHRKQPDAGTPEELAPRCKDEAVTWFSKPDGTRVYVCDEHAREAFRFAQEDEAELRDLDFHTELRPLASERGINLQNPTKEDLIERLVSPKDPGEFEDHPLVRPCPSCFAYTLVDEFALREGRCIGCTGEKTPLDVDDYPETAG